VTERLEAPASEDDPEAKAAAKLPDLLQSDRSMSKETVAQLLKDKHGIVLGVRALQRVLLAVRGKGKPGRRKGSKNKKSQHRVTKSRHPHQLNRDTRTD
jgi:uracil-DNA glycosylase